MKQEKLLQHILEAGNTLLTKKANLRAMNAETWLGVQRLIEANLIKGAFHDAISGPPTIENMPWVTLKEARVR
jgi:hypothetical protein